MNGTSRILIALVACILVATEDASGRLLDNNCATIDPNPIYVKIDGGKDADIFSNPWMVRVMVNCTAICGGSLITSRFVLTAGHCVSTSHMQVRLGEFDTRYPSKERAFTLDVDKKIVHRNYRKNSHDIGLLRLIQTVMFSDYMRPICILIDEPIGPYSIFNVTGWGKNSRGETPATLQIATLSQTDRYKCIRKFQLEDNMDWICAGSETSDACEGDSGGPLSALRIYQGQRKIFQFGVISGGLGTCNGLGFYANVAYFNNWIAGVIQNFKDFK
ncbi:serine protease grass [Drosophila eugracilis]|uniref:serine protease grass n=1 Tax=Drosophila eugracilis TaxID=29029 RepID=UPI0007E6FF8B|nr:serine protease grass [Drosophila eugracilis]